MELPERQFLQILTHDIRNMLLSAAASVAVLQAKAQSHEDIKHETDNLDCQLRRIKMLVNGLQLLPQPPSDDRITPGITNAKQLSSIVRKLISVLRPVYSVKQLSFTVTGTERIEPVGLPLESGMLEAVLYNVLINAIQYSFPKTKITVGYNVPANRHEIAVQVTDTGIAMTEEDTRHCLRMLWRGKIATATSPYGTGLGLSVVKRVLSTINGHFEISSRGNITTATIHIPIYAGGQ